MASVPGRYPGPAGSLEDLAAVSGEVLRDRSWRNRQVDTLRITESLKVRVHTSIDFTIPDRARTLGIDGGWGMGDGGEQFLLPVSVLRKWPPLDEFDLRDDRGMALPLLRGSENRAADAAVMRNIAPHLPRAVGDQLEAIAFEGDRSRARALLQGLSGLIVPLIPPGGGDDALEERVLLATVVHWASVLATNSVLWVPVRGHRGDRRVVKFDFEEPVDDLHYWRRVEQSFSWAPTVVSFDVPMLTACLTYHVQFTPPRGMDVIEANLSSTAGLREGRENAKASAPAFVDGVGALISNFGRWSWRLLGRTIAALRHEISRRWEEFNLPEGSGEGLKPEPAENVPYEDFDKQRAHLYISRPAFSQPNGKVKLRLRAARQGIITSALVASTLIAGIVTLYAIAASEIVDRHISPGVTVLVLAPGVIGLLAVRPDEHPMLRRNVRGVRGLMVAVAALPILAAILMIGIADGEVVQWAWIALAALAWVLVALITVSCLLPQAKVRGPG